MSYMLDKPPTEDKLLQVGVRTWEKTEHLPNLTASRAAYKPYSTYVFAGLSVLLELTVGMQREAEVDSMDANSCLERLEDGI